MFCVMLSILPLTMIVIFAALLQKADRRLEKQVNHLFKQSPKILGKTFTPGAIADLPEPVQHYFKKVLREGQPYCSYTVRKFNVHYIVTFNEVGEIIQLETQRYMGDKNLETWIGKLSEYKEFHGVFVPTVIEAGWKLNGQDFPYARFHLTELEYNIPQMF